MAKAAVFLIFFAFSVSTWAVSSDFPRLPPLVEQGDHACGGVLSRHIVHQSPALKSLFDGTFIQRSGRSLVVIVGDSSANTEAVLNQYVQKVQTLRKPLKVYGQDQDWASELRERPVARGEVNIFSLSDKAFGTPEDIRQDVLDSLTLRAYQLHQIRGHIVLAITPATYEILAQHPGASGFMLAIGVIRLPPVGVAAPPLDSVRDQQQQQQQ